MVTFNLILLLIHRLNQLFWSAWDTAGCWFWFWPCSATEGGLSGSRGWLRCFLLLKLTMALLLPHGAGLPLLVCCWFSLQAVVLLRSPHISTKPSTVLLGQLALADGLVPLHWGLRLVCWIRTGRGVEADPVKTRWGEALGLLCQQLLDTHHLASLLLLGLLGLEATLVSRWPQQTRRFRTSQRAQLSCSLVWMLVLLELAFSLNSKLLQDHKPQTNSSTLQISQSSPEATLPLPSIPTFSFYLRRTLWLLDLWLHYAILNSKPQKRKSSFH